MSYNITLREYRFWYKSEKAFQSSDHASILASSRLQAIDKMRAQGVNMGMVAGISRKNAVIRIEKNEWAMCEAQDWDSLMGGL